MKKIVAVVLAAALSVVLTACKDLGGDEPRPSPANAPSAPQH